MRFAILEPKTIDNIYQERHQEISTLAEGKRVFTMDPAQIAEAGQFYYQTLKELSI